MSDAEEPVTSTAPQLGTYIGKERDYGCPGDHCTLEIVLEASVCTISLTSQLSFSKGGSREWTVEGDWEWDDDDEEVLFSVTKESALGGPKRDRDVKMPCNDGSLKYKDFLCSWAKPPVDPITVEMSTMSIKELKQAIIADGVDPAGCIERGDFERVFRIARATAGPRPSPKAADATPAITAAPPATGPTESAPAPATESATASSAPAAAPATAPVAPMVAESSPDPPAQGQGSIYTLEQLTDKRTWSKLDVNSGEREIYLSDDVFFQLFGTSKEDFAKLPKWKKDGLKKKHGLF